MDQTDFKAVCQAIAPGLRAFIPHSCGAIDAVEGCDHREIAADVGVREKNVPVLLFRARKTWVDPLEGTGPEGDVP